MRRNMSKKEDEEKEEEQTMLVGKINYRKKKPYQRRQWLEKRRRKRNIIDQNQKHRNVSGGGSNRSTVRRVSTSTLPPLCWSSSSLTCHLRNEHDLNKNCLNSRWIWSKPNGIDSTTILLDNNKQILFHPRTSSSTQVILADRPLPLNGIHYWEIYVPAVYGTSIMFGIASKLTGS